MLACIGLLLAPSPVLCFSARRRMLGPSRVREPSNRPELAAPEIEVGEWLGPWNATVHDVFMRDFWQKRPLLVRGAFPELRESPLMSPDELRQIACVDEEFYDDEVDTADGMSYSNEDFEAGLDIGEDDKDGAGYEIASIDYDTNILTMADAITADSGASIQGYLPTFTAIGTVLENKNLAITFDGAPKALKSLTVEIKSPVAWQTEEITTSGYTTDYVEDRRAITLSIDALFREQDVAFFYDATKNTKVAVIAVNSNGEGNICTVNLPYVELEVPSVATSAPTVSLSIAGVALGSSGEDSCSIVFT